MAARAERDARAWLLHMRRGDYEAAWRVSDALRAETPGPEDAARPRHLRPVWRGEALAGRRVLIRCHHGLGDTIQFVRYLPRVREIAGETIVAAQPVLLPLLRHARGMGRLIPDGGPDPVDGYEVEVEVMELPYVFRTTLPTIPRAVPYIALPSDPPPPVTHPFAVGIVWRAGDWDPRRSVPHELLSPLADVPGVTLYDLQQGDTRVSKRLGTPIGSTDPVATARAMLALDLVVSVDSMPAHLAGALGVPVWTLLRAEADWRWMDAREDSPWYPTMRLIRQPREGEWRPVIERVARSLAEAARTRRVRRRWGAA